VVGEFSSWWVIDRNVPTTETIDDIDPLESRILDKIAIRVARKYGAKTYPIPKVTLARYVERIRRLPEIPFRLDPWQEDLCERLEQAFWCANAKKFHFTTVDTGTAKAYVRAPNGFRINAEEFRLKENLGTLAAIHAPPQFGKSNIIAVAYPCWIFGYDHLHRFRLATYNIMHSTRFSRAIQRILRSPEHKAMFPDPNGHLPVRTKFIEWSTNARRRLNDGQSSFTALGLTSGFVGTGADTLLQDDPYASAEDARSEIIRDSTWRFQSETAKPRLREYSNNFIMFHRYHSDDQGGRAIQSGEFELWRYAAEADGEYEEEESGRRFRCFPLERNEGEYLSTRYPKHYYQNQKKNADVWNSQFQGCPTSKAGTMFDISKIVQTTPDQLPSLIYEVRAWDNAATEKGGAFSAGARVGIDSSGNYYLLNMKRAQVDTGGRKALQASTALEDGVMVPIHFPQDPGSAGRDVAYEFDQEYTRLGYSVVVEPVTGSKVLRANDFSTAVNTGKFHVVDDGTWDIRAFKAELRDFPLVGLYKDQVDSTADAVRHLQKLFRQGRVIKVNGQINLLGWSRFVKRYGDKIPANCEVAVACRMAANSSLPSGWALVARAAENMKLGETVFVVASARKYVDHPDIIIEEIKTALRMYCAGGIEQCQVVWIAKGNDAVIELAQEKYGLYMQEFQDDEEAGLPETAWYFSQLPTANPFFDPDNPSDVSWPASRCYILSDDRQLAVPSNEGAQLSLRQDLLHWSFNDDGKPQPFGGIVLDCVRMTLHNFWLTATTLTETEKLYAQLPNHLQPQEIAKKLGTEGFVEAYWAQQNTLALIKMRQREEGEDEDARSTPRYLRLPRFPHRRR